MDFLKQLVRRHGYILSYGVLMAIMIFVLKWLQWKYVIADTAPDIYIGLIALLFTGLGGWLATQLTREKVRTVVVEKEVYFPSAENFIINEAELKRLTLTTREYEVLQLLTQGKSNGEIADKLFLSLSTVKTHVSNLFVKMDVKSRIQAVEKARRLRITP